MSAKIIYDDIHIQCGIGDLCQHKIYMLGYSMLAKVIYVGIDYTFEENLLIGISLQRHT